ncbi:hypothetical protein HK097_006669, partial [Rhizophlyctis rosea]
MLTTPAKTSTLPTKTIQPTSTPTKTTLLLPFPPLTNPLNPGTTSSSAKHPINLPAATTPCIALPTPTIKTPTTASSSKGQALLTTSIKSPFSSSILATHAISVKRETYIAVLIPIAVNPPRGMDLNGLRSRCARFVPVQRPRKQGKKNARVEGGENVGEG